jgi:hypothetical protein
MKMLVVTSTPLTAGELREALVPAEGERLEDAEVKVVAPALHKSALRFWLSDSDEAIGHAEDVRDRTVRELEREDVDVDGEAGESDPLQAIEDALRDFPADRIVVVNRPESRGRYREDVDDSEIEERFGLPVEHVVRG